MSPSNAFQAIQCGVTVRGNAKDVAITATQIVRAKQGESRQIAALFGGSAINIKAKVSQSEIVPQDHVTNGECRMLAREGESSYANRS
jgi:hypothetical protein